MNTIHPDTLRVANALTSSRLRVTSVFRADPASGGHRAGDAIDVAGMLYSTHYDDADALKALRIAKAVAPSSGWIAISEDDHVHLERTDDPSVSIYGQKNIRSQQRIVTHMYQPRRETGNAIQTVADTHAMLARPDTTHRLATRLQSPARASQSRMLAAAAAVDPEAIEDAKQVARLRSAVNAPVKWCDLKNSREISNSLGSGAVMRASDVEALVKDISNGLPVFEPQVFNFTPVPLTLDQLQFFPTFALAIGNGGPLPAAELFRWVASHIRLTSSVLNAQPGIQVRITVEFAPGPLPGNQQSLLTELGEGTMPSEFSVVHGAIAGGYPRLQTRQLAVTPGVPVAGVDFPRVLVSGVSNTLYTAAYRFMVPGDAPTDRFSAYMK